MTTSPYEIWLRVAETKEIEKIVLEPWVPLSVARRRIRQRVAGRADRYDWVGLKQGERIVFRGHRTKSGGWEWERVSAAELYQDRDRDGQPEPEALL